RAGASDAVLAAIRAARSKTTRPALEIAKTPQRTSTSWGEFIDPAGDCRVREVGGIVTITVPGAYHDLWPREGKVNAPLLLRDVEGNFTATVKVAAVTKAEEGTPISELATTVAFHA